MTEPLRRALETTDGGAGPHVTEEQWERWAMNELSPDERLELLDHVTGCAECRAIYRALDILAAEAHAFDPGAPQPSRGRPRIVTFSGRGLLAAMVAAAAAVGIVFVLRPVGAPSHPAVPHVRSAGTLSRPLPLEPGEETVTARIVFRWKPVKGMRAAVVELLDARGEPIWISPETKGTELTLPDRLNLEEGTYYWRVTALGPGGERLSSELVRFSVARRPRR